MKNVWLIICAQWKQSPLSFGVAILVAVLPAAAGILLLGVSGWFITAAAIAGLSGLFLNIFVPSAIIRALAIIRTAGRYGERVLTHDATFRFLANLRNSLFAFFASREFGQSRSGALLSRLTQDLDVLDEIYLRLVVPVSLALICSLGLILFWASLSDLVLLSGLVFLSAWGLLAYVSFTRANRNASRRADAASEAMRIRSSDMVAGRKDLAIYGGLDAAADTVLLANERFVQAENVGEKRAIRLASLSTFIGQVFLSVSLIISVWGLVAQEFSPALAVGLVLVVLALPELFGQMLPGLARIPRIALAAGRAGQATLQAEEPQVALSPSGNLEAVSSGFALEFQGVSFAYPGAEQPVIRSLSFKISPGETVAISGRSGCGKSTIAKLAARLLLPDQGEIRLNGRRLRNLAEPDLRQSVTVLSQRAYIFNDTIAANLRVANESATEGELWAALEQAALNKRIAESSAGLQTVLGEGGLGLSGGERRRLALARAFLTRPSLFILDEMTEGLDLVTAADVLQRFKQFKAEASVLMIAHKQLELDVADRILPLTETLSG